MRARVGVLLLTVRDFPRMLAFYRDQVGFPLGKVHPGEGYRPLSDWARFEPNGPEGTALELFDEKKHPRTFSPPFPRNNAVTIAFNVDDIKSAYEDLVRQGVEFTQPIGEQEWGWYVHFRDPEGNLLQLYQPRPGY